MAASGTYSVSFILTVDTSCPFVTCISAVPIDLEAKFILFAAVIKTLVFGVAFVRLLFFVICEDDPKSKNHS